MTQARHRPSAVAVEQAGATLTYEMLERRSAEVAACLRSTGVVVVAVCLPRSPDLIVALLGVLRAGGAYLPVDPALPPDRIRGMLREADPAVVVTRTGVLPVGLTDGRRVLLLDAEGELGPGTEGSARVSRPDDLAYVLYTSGSTGIPRGVMVEHRAVSSYVEAAARMFGLRPTDRVLQFASVSVDVAVEEIFVPLSVGATVVLRTDEMLDSVPGFLASCRDQRISVLTLPTAYWHELIPWLGDEPLPETVQSVVVGGESMIADRLADWRRKVPPAVRLFNMYGPTEATVSAVADQLHLAAPDPWEPDTALDELPSPPIGRPIPGHKAYVLGDDLEPVPTGLPGELYLGGAGLARGYLGAPGRTAERFVPDPFGAEPGGRLYRTGDRVRWLPDGRLMFLGRVDAQVKIRGYRVELGEIEGALRQAPGVQDAAVTFSPPTGRVVGYVAVGTGVSVDPEEVRRHLRSMLPSYAVPTNVVVLPVLPRSPSGKVERSALPAPGDDAAATLSPEPTADPISAAVTAVWADILQRPSVGPRDDFFALGGHSLLAVQVCSRLRDLFQVEVPVRDVFEHPTPAALAALVMDQVARRHADTPSPPPARAPIEPRPGGIPLEPSVAQERLWFLAKLQPGLPAYNLAMTVPFLGPLNPDALSRSIDTLVQRHEALRTVFPDRDGLPGAELLPPIRGLMAEIDLRDRPEGARSDELGRLIAAEIDHSFDLSRGPLLRATLVRAAADVHYLLLTTHHIAADGWSLGILRRDLERAYDAYSRGRDPDFSALPVRYADFVWWQRQRLTGVALADRLKFWWNYLAGAPPRLELPTDSPRPPFQTFRGAWRLFHLDHPTVAGLLRLARRRQATPFMAFLTAFVTLLRRYSGQDDIVVGTPVANRDGTGLEDVVGYFVNTLPVRVRIPEDATGRSLVDRIRGSALEMQAHQDLAFERLLDELHPERDVSYAPVFQVMFAFQSLPAALPVPPRRAADVDETRVGRCAAKFDLVLSIDATQDGWLGYLEYNADLFDDTTAARLIAHYRTLIGELGRHPDAPVASLRLITGAESRAVLQTWNQTSFTTRGARTVPEMLERATAEHPDRVALEQSGLQLTYREAAMTAGRLAARLRGLGVGPERVVAVCVERSPALAVALWAVLRAGGAYLPLDPSYPSSRLSSMLADSGADLVVVGKRDQFRFADLRVRALVVDDHGLAIGDESSEPPESPALAPFPSQLAYLIYTSGTTGRPKGSAIQHAGLGNLTAWWASAFGLKPGDRTTAVCSPSFDAHVVELWPSLAAGATVCYADEIARMDPLGLVKWLTDLRITVSFLPTPLGEAVLSLPWPPTLRLRALLTAGDRLRVWPRSGLPFRVFNLYGPTETSVCATVAELAPPLDGRSPLPPIGGPAGNVRLFVLDEHLEPAPVGVPGELYIGGAGVGRGYYRQPGLTAERFVPDPFGPEPGGRLYRTGDVVRWRPNGELDFLHRNDSQVKVRGFRIELGEVEAALCDEPGVAAAAVVAVGEGPERRLVGFVVPEEGAAPATEPLSAALGRKLPPYMIPRHIVLLPELPLTPNGKLDRAALAKREPPASRREDLQTGLPLERELSRIWAELVGRPPATPDDNFFDSGGHSLLLTQLASRLAEVVGTELSLRPLFESPTFEGFVLTALAGMLDSALTDEAERLFAAAERAQPTAPAHPDTVGLVARVPVTTQ
ncbi:MAG: amino acid adenylation domain-containing protein [Isosphaeraceae bacterium]|nr:amino acid adenylation domain-containing protein [Isosphaeraceae bacterium]